MISPSQTFSPMQRALHWIMAACILAMLFIGVAMVTSVAPAYLGWIALHKSLGLIVLVLVLIRLVIRWRLGAPALPSDLPLPLKLGAKLSHYALYALMLAMPLLGWAMLSAAGYPVIVFGAVRLPAIAPRSLVLHSVLWDAHHYLGIAFYALILLHLGAALFHGLIRRDGVLQTMIPGFSRQRQR